MREIQFRVVSERPGHLEAQADVPTIRPIAAPTLEELQHEAREALIEHYGPAHGVYRVRMQRNTAKPRNTTRAVRHEPAPCC